MAIKVIVNYPQTEEGIKLLDQRMAEAVLQSLKKICTPAELDSLIEKLKVQVKEEQSKKIN